MAYYLFASSTSFLLMYFLGVLLTLIVVQQAAECLHGIEQSPGSSVMEAIQPCLNAVAREDLLKHQDEDVKVLLATCFCEITRITAPEAPYNDDVLRVTIKSALNRVSFT